MDKAELAKELERLANTDIREGDPTVAIAYLVHENLPAILAALNAPAKDEAASFNAGIAAAAKQVVALARNEGVATGNGKLVWGAAIDRLEQALSPTKAADAPKRGEEEEKKEYHHWLGEGGTTCF